MRYARLPPSKVVYFWSRDAHLQELRDRTDHWQYNLHLRRDRSLASAFSNADVHQFRLWPLEIAHPILARSTMTAEKRFLQASLSSFLML